MLFWNIRGKSLASHKKYATYTHLKVLRKKYATKSKKTKRKRVTRNFA